MREKVELPNDPSIVNEYLEGSRNTEWRWIKDDHKSSDLEKGIQYKETILQRKVDNKYFKFEWAHTSQHSLDEAGLNRWPLEGEEVFPVEKTITIYK
jgi:hypothetical protein